MFSEDNHTAEEKLWDSYRDSEAREVYTKKILLDLQKVHFKKRTVFIWEFMFIS